MNHFRIVATFSLACALPLGACSDSHRVPLPQDAAAEHVDGGPSATVTADGMDVSPAVGAASADATSAKAPQTDGGSASNGPDGSAPDASTDGATNTQTSPHLASDASVLTQSGPDGGGAPATTPFHANDAGQVLCGTAPCACADGIDNDGDGVTDLADPECVASWDNDEGSFATGIPGDNRDDACQDCFFDGNSGSGNDGCRLPTSCLTLGTAASGHGSCSQCEQSQHCQDFCKPYTPNGCDCFGCCEVRVGGIATQHVLLSAGCSLDGSSLSGCTSCVPSTTCQNACGTCELCAGKTAADLPPECFPPAADGGIPSEPPSTCGDSAVCGEGLAPCASGSLCQFGCCLLTPAIP